MIKFFKLLIPIVLFIVTIFHTNFGLCQLPNWPPYNLDTCTSLTSQFGKCTGAITFCIGDSVGVKNDIFSGSIDSSFINWKDGTFFSDSGNLDGCVKHFYNYPQDSNTCILGSGNGLIIITIEYAGVQFCPNGKTASSDGTNIQIHFKPYAEFTIIQDTVCENEPITIVNHSCVNTSLPQHMYYYWDWTSDGIIDTITASGSPPPSHSYPNQGTYNITLHDTNECGYSSYQSIPIVVQPTVNFVPIFNIQSPCTGIPFSPYVDSTGLTNFIWTHSGGGWTINNINIAQPTIILNNTSPPPYIITVTSRGCCPPYPPHPGICQADTTVNVQQGPSLNQILPIPVFCDSNTVFPLPLSNYYTASGTSFSWSINHNGSNIYYSTVNPPPPVNYTGWVLSGMYIDSFYVSTSCGDTLLVDTFYIQAPPALTLPLNQTVCNGASPITIIATPAPGLWTLNGFAYSDTTFIPANALQDSNVFVYTYGTGSCQVKDSFLVVVIGTNVTAGPDISMCGNVGSVDLDTIGASPPGGIWINPNVIGSIYTPPGGITTDMVIYQFDTLGCSIFDTLIVYIISGTSAAMTILPNDTVCINDSVFFDGNNGVSSLWYFGDGGTSILNDPFHVYTDSGSYTVKLVIQDNGCKDSTQQVITVLDIPSASFSLSTHDGCSILPVIITNNSSVTGQVTYSWNFGNGDTSNNANPGTVFYSQGINDTTYYITLHITHQCGLPSYSDSVIVHPSPHAAFGTDYDTICSYQTVCFSNISFGNPLTYQWLINNSFVSSAFNLPCQTFTTGLTDSIYTIWLIDSNQCGKDSTFKNVVVRPGTIQAFFNASDTSICAGQSITFTSFVNGATSVNWNFGDNATATGDTVVHMYTVPGTYFVWQKVYGCGVDSISRKITVAPLPAVAFTTIPVLCNNQLVQFQNTYPGLAQYIWIFGDSSPNDSSSISPSHLYPSAGSYNVTLIGIASGTEACSNIYQSAIVINAAPQAAFSVLNPSDHCVPDTVTVLCSSTGLSLYQWNFGDGNIIVNNQSSITHVYQSSGNFSIHLTVTDNTGCQNDSISSVVVVHPLPTANFTYQLLNICQTPANVQFIAAPALSYFWNFGTTTSTIQSPLLSFTSNITFNASLTVTNSYGCHDDTVKNINIYTKPIVAFTPLDAAFCQNSEISFINNSLNVTQYQWNFGDGWSSTTTFPFHAFSDTGIYTITLIANDSICQDTAYGSVTITPSPQADFTSQEINNTSTLSNSGVFQYSDNSFVAQNDSIVSYYWEFANDSTSNLQNPIHSYYSRGIKCVKLTVTNKYGCTDDTIKCDTIYLKGSFYLPNVFTPSETSSEKGYFIPKGVGLSSFEIEIFSPFGERVWHVSATEDNGLVSDGQPASSVVWDGIYNHNALPQGAYSIKAKAKFKGSTDPWNGEGNEKTKLKCSGGECIGSVIIIR